MIFDFPVFLYTILPIVQILSLLIIGITSIICILEWIYKFRVSIYGHVLTRNEIVTILGVNLLMQLVVFPCADIGANCWMNCFKFVTVGQLGYFSSYAVLALIIFMILIFHAKRVSFLAIPVVLLYGFFGFLQIAYLDKGLWCIVRSSGYDYLWGSFELVIAIQWIVYFATISLLYLDLQTRYENS